MEIVWEVDDGYVGRNRPQRSYIDREDILECDSFEEAREMILEHIANDFIDSISWYIKNEDKFFKELENLFKEKE